MTDVMPADLTEEMISAGADVLCEHDPGWDSQREIIIEIYRAMTAARGEVE